MFNWPEIYCPPPQKSSMESSIASSYTGSKRASKQDDSSIADSTVLVQSKRTLQANELLISATPWPDNTDTRDRNEMRQVMYEEWLWETLHVDVCQRHQLSHPYLWVCNAPNNKNKLLFSLDCFGDTLDHASDVHLH